MRKNKKRQHFVICILAAIPVWFFSAQGRQRPEQQILTLMKSRDASIKAVLGEEGTSYTVEQKNELKELINNVIDFKEMSKIALDRYWEGLSDEEITEFVSIFSELVRRSSLKKLDIFRAEIEYKDIEIENDIAVARTIATYEQTKTNVDYKFRAKNNQWYVTDFLIDDVSTAESYKKSFQKIIRKHSYSGLIERMKKKLAEKEEEE
jgi:phospholipid transport system substrate-binding protein